MAETANRQLQSEALRSVDQAGDVLQKIGDRVEAFAGLVAGNPKLVNALATGDAETRKAAFVSQFSELSKSVTVSPLRRQTPRASSRSAAISRL